jgi:hypothetical protein
MTPGDLLIIRRGPNLFELVDATTREPITIGSSCKELLRIGARRHGAVWQENLDNRGRPLSEPILVLPRLAG